jgi:hypothetical protein
MDARNAIIQADDLLTGGENFCEIWSGFAAKGLGADATVIGKTPWGGGIRTNVSPVPGLSNLRSLGVDLLTFRLSIRVSLFQLLVKSRADLFSIARSLVR